MKKTDPTTQPKQQNTPTRLAKLDGLLGHLSSSSGLYSKETFLSLYGCITRMVRDHRLPGFVMTRTLGDEDFESLATSLEGRPDLELYRLDESDSLPESAGISPATGFLIVLTDRQCAVISWNVDARKSFQMYRGGWTFHPSDTKTIASHLIGHLTHHTGSDALQKRLDETPVDRRYDDKLNTLVTSLVNGLENQSRDLAMALQQVKDLNQQRVEQERLAAIGQLCSVVAHEIRNPLGLIDLYAKLIEAQTEQLELLEGQEEKTDALYKNIRLIRQSIESLESILSELTSYSRPLTLTLKPVSVIDMVTDICDFYRPSYDEKAVDLQVITPNLDNTLILNLDRGRIQQALINLLKNALEVSKAKDQVTVVIASRKNDDRVYIKVTDQGPGVEQKARKKLFTPYFSTKKNGTGLGLAHSRKILQAHGGSVELLNTPTKERPRTKGSTFALVLPKDVKAITTQG